MILRKKKNYKGYQVETCEQVYLDKCNTEGCNYNLENDCAGWECVCPNPTLTCKTNGACECKDGEFLNDYGNCEKREPLGFWGTLLITLFFLLIIFMGFILPIYTFYKVATSDEGKIISHWYNPWYRPSPTFVIGNTGSSIGQTVPRIINTKNAVAQPK